MSSKVARFALIASVGLATVGWLWIFLQWIVGNPYLDMAESRGSVGVAAMIWVSPVLLVVCLWWLDNLVGRIALLSVALLYCWLVLVTTIAGGALFWPAALALLVASTIRSVPRIGRGGMAALHKLESLTRNPLDEEPDDDATWAATTGHDGGRDDEG